MRTNIQDRRHMGMRALILGAGIAGFKTKLPRFALFGVLILALLPLVHAQTLWTGNVGQQDKWVCVSMTTTQHPAFHGPPYGGVPVTGKWAMPGPVKRIWLEQRVYHDGTVYYILFRDAGGRIDSYAPAYSSATVISLTPTNDPAYGYYTCADPSPTPPPPTSGTCQNGASEEVSASKVIKFNFAKLGIMPSRLTKLNKVVQKLLGEGTVKVVQGAGFIGKQASPIVVEPVVEFLPKGEAKIDHKRDCCNSKWSNAYYNLSGKVTLLTIGAKAKVKLPIPQFPALAVVGSREVSAEASIQGKPQRTCASNNSTSLSSLKGEAIVGLKFESKLGLGDTAGVVSGQGVVKATVAYPLPVSLNVDTANLVQGVTVGAAKTQIALYAEIGFESCMLDGGFCYYTKSLPLMDTTYDLLW